MKGARTGCCSLATEFAVKYTGEQRCLTKPLVALSAATHSSQSRRSMDILFLLIPLSVVLVLLVGLAFWWSVRSGQFDDLKGPAHRILDDDDAPGEDDSG